MAKGSRKPTRRKALLAIAFAGGMLNSPTPVLSQNEPDSTTSVIQLIANNTKYKPETRALNLLRLAKCYLTEADTRFVERQFTRLVTDGADGDSRPEFSRRQNVFAFFADEISLLKCHTSNDLDSKTKSGVASASKENIILADSAIKQALMLLDKSYDLFARLNMYFIASRLLEKTGDVAGAHKCNIILEKAFKSCEASKETDEVEIKAASSVLNSMAYGLIPLHMPDSAPKDIPWEGQAKETGFAQKDIKEWEKLKLSMVDRLAATNDLRRRAHRDLSLWYMYLGQTDIADAQKQILFELIGRKDDRLLYPQRGTCGSLRWWIAEPVNDHELCGMG